MGLTGYCASPAAIQSAVRGAFKHKAWPKLFPFLKAVGYICEIEQHLKNLTDFTFSVADHHGDVSCSVDILGASFSECFATGLYGGPHQGDARCQTEELRYSLCR